MGYFAPSGEESHDLKIQMKCSGFDSRLRYPILSRLLLLKKLKDVADKSYFVVNTGSNPVLDF